MPMAAASECSRAAMYRRTSCLSSSLETLPLRPAWSPDGRTIALYEIGEFDPRVVFVDVATGAETIREARGGFQPRGLAWLGPASLVLSQPEEEGQRIQLWRMSYPDGAVSPLTNDLNSYIGVDLDSSRGSVVTMRRETRTSLWVGDAAGVSGKEMVPPTLFTGRFVWVSWAGERVLYNSTSSGRASVAALRPDGGVDEDLAPAGPNLLSGVGTSDGRTLVYARRNDGVWKTDAAGRFPVQLTADEAFDVRMTPDDRYVVFLSSRSGVEALWTIPIDGGQSTQDLRRLDGLGNHRRVFTRPADFPGGRILHLRLACMHKPSRGEATSKLRRAAALDAR